MNKAVLLAGVASIALVAAGSAQANGTYLSLQAGANILEPFTLSSTSDYPLSGYPRRFDFETGFATTAAIGHRITPFFRVEGELAFRYNSLSGLTVQGEGPAAAGGHISAFSAMVNGWFDVPTGTNVMPYFGGGLGAAAVDFSASNQATGGFYALNYKASPVLFAYQLGAGLAIGMKNGSAFTFDYRYFKTSDFNVSFSGDYTGTASGGSYAAQSLMVGFRAPIGGP